MAREFFRTEYRVNAQIANYAKPFVALMDGIVMGGGIGLGSHACIRVVTERSALAMPEVSIGLVPDVGGTYLLSRAPANTGIHLALTGVAIGAGDAIHAGLADHFVPAERLSRLTAALRSSEPLDAVASLAEPAPEAPLAGAGWLRDCYAWQTVEQIMRALRRSSDPAAGAAADLIATKSPTALKVTHESLRRSAALATLEEVLEQEFRVSCACLESADLIDGIRAQVIDKDRSPTWSPERLDQVTRPAVLAFFADHGQGTIGPAP